MEGKINGIMNREELYYKTVDVLLDAYNDGELEHNNCEACAVGNICKEASVETDISNDKWMELFSTAGLRGDLSQDIIEVDLNRPNHCMAVQLIKSTGYTVEELANIEFAFEFVVRSDIETFNKAVRGTHKEIKHYQYIGLCSVLDVLKDIHEVTEEVNDLSFSRLDKCFSVFKNKCNKIA